MARFVLDTNILLGYLRQNEDLIGRINKDLDLDHPQSENFISVVSKAEIMALAIRNGSMKGLQPQRNQNPNAEGSTQIAFSAVFKVSALCTGCCVRRIEK